MHIVYIHQHFATKDGTTGTRSYEMSQRLIRHGHRVTMICGAYKPGGLDTEHTKSIIERTVDGINVACISEPYSNQMSFVQRIRAFGRFARKATQIACKLKDADLVFATSTPLTVGIPAMKAGKRLRIPFVFEVRDLWPEIPIAIGAVRNPALIYYLRRMERKIYQAAHHIIALSPGMKEGIINTGYSANRITMIPNGCDLELFRPNRELLEDDRFGHSTDFRLVFAGAHGQANGLDAVLDAIAILKQRGEKGLRFVFIGDGNRRERLIERSRSDGTTDMISWVPPIPKMELARILPRMDVGMMILKNLPVFYRGTSPNKFFDYIASGLPTLNNYPGWVADMIENNRCGVVVPPNEPNSFADAVVNLRDNLGLRQQMGTRARSLAKSEFARDRLGELFVSTLEQARDSFDEHTQRSRPQV